MLRRDLALVDEGAQLLAARHLIRHAPSAPKVRGVPLGNALDLPSRSFLPSGEGMTALPARARAATYGPIELTPRIALGALALRGSSVAIPKVRRRVRSLPTHPVLTARGIAEPGFVMLPAPAPRGRKEER